jgi:hypothetical protein
MIIDFAFLSSGYRFAHAQVRMSALGYYFETYQYYDHCCDFTCSHGCLIDFKLRVKFSHRTHHSKPQGNITEGDIGAWTGTLTGLLI